jgi:cytochrome c oxidase cbb3-type subunit III
MTMLESHEHKRPVHNFDGITENRVNSPPAYFNVLFYALVIWAVAFMAYFLFSGWSSKEEFQTKMAAHQEQVAKQTPPPAAASSTAAPIKADAEAGAKIFAQHCAMCHGAEGKGGIGPDLTRTTFTYGKSEDDIRHTIEQGRPNGMPAFGNQLSEDQIENVAAFVLSLK